MVQVLRKVVIQYKEKRLISKNDAAVIKIGNETKEANIRKGIRQGCFLSSIQDALGKRRCGNRNQNTKRKQ